MPTGQQYSTNVPPTYLTGLINATTTSFSVASSSGWPSVPFTAILDIGFSNQEPVDVTNIVGTTWTVTRNIDGTLGFAHAVGATVTHGDIGRDFREARSHIDASSSNDASGHNIHGLTTGSSVVGTTDAQTLSNKTISAGTYTGAQVMGSGNWSGSGILTEAAVGVTGLTGAAGNTRHAGATAGGPPTSGTFIAGDLVTDSVAFGLWLCTTGGSPGTWAPIGGRFLLSTTSLSANSVGVSLPAYASNFKNLIIEIYGKDATSNGNMNLRFNGDSGNNYFWEHVFIVNNGSLTGNSSAGATNAIPIGSAGQAASTNGAGAVIAEILQFNNTSFRKQVTSRSAAGDAATAGIAGGELDLFTGHWANTAAITSITMFLSGGDTWTAGSVMNIYGTN